MKRFKKHLGIILTLILIIAILVMISVISSNTAFDASKYDSDKVHKHIRELTSGKYEGRLAGYSGNEKAMEYIADFFTESGIEPAGDNGTYFQEFSVMVPDIDTEPEFTIKNDDGDIITELTMYQDYKALPNMNGGGIDYTGDLLLVKNNLKRIDAELIKDKIIVITASNITPDYINYVLINGGSGILCATDPNTYIRSRYHEIEKEVSVAGKTGPTIFAGYISDKTYRELEKVMEVTGAGASDNTKPNGIVKNAHIKVDINFPIVETANILGKIEGRSKNGRILMISANVDGNGKGTDGRYFPGAISNTTGLAILLETAGMVKRQDNLPFETIVFVGWNGQKQQFSGSEHYLANPIYPPEKTTLIHLDDLGYETMEGLKISSDSVLCGILKDKISNYAEDIGVKVSKTIPFYGPATRFADYGAPAVMLGDAFYQQDTYYDIEPDVDAESLQNAALVLLNYIKRESFRDMYPDYIGVTGYILISVLGLLLLASFVIGNLYKKTPGLRIGRGTAEGIYYSTSATFLRKAIQIFVPVGIALGMLVFLANIDPTANAGYVNNTLTTNFSWYLTLKKTFMYFGEFGAGVGKGAGGTIFRASLRSIALMLSSLAVSVIIGIASGMLEGYRTRRKNLRSLGSLVIFSIPDVLIVLAGILLYVLLAKNMQFIITIPTIKKYIFPLITLSVLPSIYITRITYIAIQDEMRLDYVRNARAKGLSRKKIFISEILPAVAFKIVDTLPAIMTMLLSNMIIVEYMFNSLGILHYLIYFYNRQNVNGFVTLAIILGLIYIVLTWGIQLLAGFVNPLKRRAGR